MEKTAFKGKVYMTHPTKAIYKWLLADFVKVTGVSSAAAEDDQLYTEADLTRSYERITAINYHQEIEVDGIKFFALNAGHVLGAAMFMIEIAGVRVLYTGDYSREEDRHLMAAETPSQRPDVLVCESTYGVHSHQPRLERERRFTELVHNIVGRGGRCLIPVFALGRAQELLLILDEYWQAHPELHGVPVYYASALAKKCMAVYQTYVNMMNERIQRQIAISNPFIFRHVSNLRSMDQFKDSGPCVMMASPAMLQNGLSRELLELWAPNPKNGLIVPGYVVEGTLGKHILTEPKEFTGLAGVPVPLRMSVEYISFSAHVDFGQNSEFIDILKPPHLILVHGEAGEMQRLKNALQHKYGLQDKNQTASHFALGSTKPDTIINIHTPRNCESVELTYRGEKIIKIVGSLTERHRKLGENNPAIIEGVLVGKDFEYQLMAPEDLPEYLPAIKKIEILEKQVIRCGAKFSLIEFLLTQLYGRKAVERVDGSKGQLLILKEYKLQVDEKQALVTVEWNGNPMNDLIADSIVFLIMGAETSKAAVKATKLEHSQCGDEHEHSSHEEGQKIRVTPGVQEQQKVVKSYLEGTYGPVELVTDAMEGDHFAFSLHEQPVQVSTSDFSVICEDKTVFEKVTRTLHKIITMFDPNIII